MNMNNSWGKAVVGQEKVREKLGIRIMENCDKPVIWEYKQDYENDDHVKIF